MNIKTSVILLSTVLAIASCATQKTAVSRSSKGGNATVAAKATDTEKQKIDFLDRVNENASYQKNIVASITFTASQNGGKEITVPGQLRMRKDEVIRLSLQVPIIGSEVGRIEFGKDYVLFVDRMHKEYIKTSYDKVAFLRDNGINFYTLQALFWNKLYLPGKTQVGYTDLGKFSASLDGSSTVIPVTLSSGKLKYTWTANRTTGIIGKARVDYTGNGSGTSSLTWDYSDFRTFGSKKFPYGNTMTIVTPATGKTKTLKASFKFNDISTSSDWQPVTTLSGKYKQVEADDILGKLMKQ